MTEPIHSKGFDLYEFAAWCRARVVYCVGAMVVAAVLPWVYSALQPQGPGGFRTVDDDRLYNGPGDRYDWKIVGKREISRHFDIKGGDKIGLKALLRDMEDKGLLAKRARKQGLAILRPEQWLQQVHAGVIAPSVP